MKSLLLLFLAYRAVLLEEKLLKKSKFFMEKMKNKKEGVFEKIIFVYSGIAHWNPCSPLSSNMPDPFSCYFSFDHSDSKKPACRSTFADLVRGSCGNIILQSTISHTANNNKCHGGHGCHSLRCVIITTLTYVATLSL